MAEIEDASVPVGSGVPLLDTLGGAPQQQMNAKEIAHLPRPRFEPVSVYVGRAPGYAGPVARARAPGAPVGEQPDLAAYAAQPDAGDASASPISKPAPDAVSLRRAKHAKAVKAAKADAAKVDAVIADEPAAKPKAARSATKPKAAAAQKPAGSKAHSAAEQGKS
jgi:D-alanyl-D-alanine carboxypeptidase